MTYLRSLLLLATAALVVLVLWWVELRGLAVFVAVGCGFAGLIYLTGRNRGSLSPEEERDKHEARVQRDIPPPPSN